MAERPAIAIDIVSDAVCPWCFIGRKRLGKAIDSLPDVAVDIRWRPFQLDPTIPPEGKDRGKYLLDKFHDQARIDQMHERIAEAGAAEGIDFDFAAIKIAPNTLDAHRLIRWAAGVGDDAQDRLARRLFELYFEEGADIGDRGVLVETARGCGIDSALVETLLATDADSDAVRNEIATAARMGVTGVPCFLLEGRYAVMGAQEPAALADAIRQVATAKARGEIETTAERS